MQHFYRLFKKWVAHLLSIWAMYATFAKGIDNFSLNTKKNLQIETLAVCNRLNFQRTHFSFHFNFDKNCKSVHIFYRYLIWSLHHNLLSSILFPPYELYFYWYSSFPEDETLHLSKRFGIVYEIIVGVGKEFGKSLKVRETIWFCLVLI